jgi:hypothetical protein
MIQENTQQGESGGVGTSSYVIDSDREEQRPREQEKKGN